MELQDEDETRGSYMNYAAFQDLVLLLKFCGECTSSEKKLYPIWWIVDYKYTFYSILKSNANVSQ